MSKSKNCAARVQLYINVVELKINKFKDPK